MNGEIGNTLKGAKYYNSFGLKLLGFEYYLLYTRVLDEGNSTRFKVHLFVTN